MVTVFLLGGILASALGLAMSFQPALFLAVLLGGVLLFLLYFFRDPVRQTPSGPGLVVAPSDGRVLSLEKVMDSPYVGGAGLRISVFLSPLDVHIIRSPLEGVVDYASYHPGKFIAAYKNEASQNNERLEMGLSSQKGKVILKQIAGFLARRIVCHAVEKQPLARGERLGIIKFGSRVELVLPSNVEIKIREQELLKGGETVVGVFR